MHAAVLGMTGAGKSNAVKVLIGRLLTGHRDLRIMVVDSHGEYRGLGGVGERSLTVRFEPCLLDEVWVKRACRAGRALNDVMDAVHAALEQAGAAAGLDELADAIDAEAPGGKIGEWVKRLAQAVRETPHLRLTRDAATVIEMGTAGGPNLPVEWSAPGLYVLDLVTVFSYIDRINQTAAVATAGIGLRQGGDGQNAAAARRRRGPKLRAGAEHRAALRRPGVVRRALRDRHRGPQVQLRTASRQPAAGPGQQGHRLAMQHPAHLPHGQRRGPRRRARTASKEHRLGCSPTCPATAPASATPAVPRWPWG